MFDEVTKREGGKRAARKSAYLAGSTAFQVGFLALLIFASEKIRSAVADQGPVEVKFVKTAAPPPPPPPPPAPPRPKNAPKPPPDAPRPKPPPPTAMIQPKDVKEEIKLPDPSDKPEPVPDYGGDEGGEGGGVVGGVVGAPPAGGGGIEDAPQYATAGWRPPQMKVKNCVQNSVRIPRDLAGIVSSVVVKFGVKPSGEPYAFSIVGTVPDERIKQAVWNAISSCQWIPGADAAGRPVSIWVTFPLRFTAG